MSSTFITTARSNIPTKICPDKGQVEENRRTLNLNPILSFPGGIDRRRRGGGRPGRTHSSHFVSVLFKFHQLFGVWPQTELNLKYCGEGPDIFLHLKHVSSYTNSFAECKHNLKEREDTPEMRDHLEGFPEIWNGTIFMIWHSEFSAWALFFASGSQISILPRYISMALTAPVSSKESTPCDFKVCNNKTLGYYNLNTLLSWNSVLLASDKSVWKVPTVCVQAPTPQ